VNLVNPSEREPETGDHFQSEVRLRYEEALSQYCLIGRLNAAASLIERLPDLCVSLVNILIEFTTAENCSIMLLDSAGDLRMVVAKGRDDQGSFYGVDALPTTVFSYGEGAAGWAVKNAQLVRIGDCEADSRFVRRESAVKTVNSVICAPITTGEKALGVINCSHPKKEKFSEKDEHKVSLVAEHAGILLQKALFVEQLKSEIAVLNKQVAQENQKAQGLDSQLTELREQLYKSERFSTLGELLAGVAHELNNRVAPILIYSQMLQEKALDEKDGKRLRIIEESAISAKAILETLLSYSRPDNRERGPVNLNQTLQNTLTLTEYKLRNHGIALELDLCPHLPPVVVNEKQIAQVFLNVANNALSAMETKGGCLKISSAHDDHVIRFVVSDSGPGVDEEIASKIFDPFFTTKESGKGTGLGLSISRRYVEEHNGTIYLGPSNGSGATFVIEIARTDIRTISEKPDGDSPPLEQFESSARILVVEDDSTIRDVIRDILGTRYDIEFANDGNEATSKIENDLYDLLVVDYHMPGLDGKQLYEWITRNRPSLKRRVVFSTGDIFHDDIRDFIKGTGCHSLTKPFSTSDLREMISGALNA
jgi:signal transduction histidine kinase